MTHRGRDLLREIKASAGRSPGIVLPVGSPVTALLRPVATGCARADAPDVLALTEWRNRHVGAFLTEFVATPDRTARWLNGPVAADDGKIVFMLDDLAGSTFGYMGLALIDWVEGAGEADSIVRGRPALPGAMTAALLTMLGWARGTLGLDQLGVRVRSDNPALRFYDSAGFVERFRVPLAWRDEPGQRTWYEDRTVTDPAVELVHMVLEMTPSGRDLAWGSHS